MRLVRAPAALTVLGDMPLPEVTDGCVLRRCHIDEIGAFTVGMNAMDSQQDPVSSVDLLSGRAPVSRVTGYEDCPAVVFP